MRISPPQRIARPYGHSPLPSQASEPKLVGRSSRIASQSCASVQGRTNPDMQLTLFDTPMARISGDRTIGIRGPTRRKRYAPAVGA
jgi:hypothetical protein